jgi:hypothetical protein
MAKVGADDLDKSTTLESNKSLWLMQLHRARGNFARCIECCDAGIRLAAEIGSLPVMYPTEKAYALLYLGRYDAAWASLQREIADEAHPGSGAW